MSKADMRFSSGTWVGNLYQKFEEMCQEVDDMVGQEHIKSLETHVQLVGDNVMKFCSNVKELIPSSFGASGKHETQSVNSVESDFDLEEGDGEQPSSCIQVSDDLHFEDNRFSINQDYGSHCEEEKESSGMSEVSCPDSYFTDQSSGSFVEKNSHFDASESTCNGSSVIAENSDSFTTKEEEFLLNISEFIFPDEDPCEASTSSVSHNQNHEPVDDLASSVSPSEDSSASGFLLKEETVQDTVDEYSSGPDFLCKDEMANDSIHENSQGSEFQLEEDVLCDSISECSLGSQACLKEETTVHDSAHKQNPGSEFRMEEGVVNDSLLNRCLDVPIDNVAYTLLATSVTSSDSETSNVRLASSVNFPLLDFQDETETGSETFTSSADSQSSESSSCSKVNAGDMDSSLASSSTFTEVPIIPLNDSVGHNLEHTELPVKLDLGGTLVLLKDGNHKTLSALQRSWLCEKMIKGRLSARKKLEKEYKQLAIWYGDIDAMFDEGSGEKLTPSSHNKQLPSQDLQESEWELL